MKNRFRRLQMNLLGSLLDVAKVHAYQSHPIHDSFESPQIALGTDKHGHFLAAIEQASRQI
jgi:hypothetical protein